MNQIRLLNRKYVYESTLETNISTDYVDGTSSTWGEWELVRECMQNMMDEADYLVQEQGGHLSDHLHVSQAARHGSKWWCLRDMGRGTDVANILYLGLSGKRGQGYRGEKGEGQLLAFLVAVRKKIGLIFASQDYLLIPRISDDNRHPHLALDLYRVQKPIVGTRIYIENTPSIKTYLKGRREFFPDLVKPKGPEKSPSKRKIFDPDDDAAKLYLKGILVRQIDALFSYNLSQSRISRDRDVVSEDDLIDEMREIWNEVVSVRKITRLLKEACEWGSEKLEMRIPFFTLGQKQQRAWRKAFRELAGHSRVVLWTNDLIAREARRKQYVAIRIEQQPLFEALCQAGIKKDCDVAKAQDPYQELKPNKDEHTLFALFDDIADRCHWENGRTFKVFKPTGADASYDKRLAFQRGNYLYFNRSHLAHSTFGELLQTFVHEETHRQCGAPDESREFEAGQARLWLDIVKYASGHVNHQLVTWNAQQTQLI